MGAADGIDRNGAGGGKRAAGGCYSLEGGFLAATYAG